MMKKKLLFTTTLLFLLLSIVSGAHAAGTLSISPGGSGVFVVQGVGLDSIAAVKFTIGYDVATLANPRVEQGNLMSGALMVANANTPGFIQVAFVYGDPRGITGSGPVATIKFDRRSASPGKILTFKVDELVNAAAKQVDAGEAKIENPSDSSTTTAENGGPATQSQQTASQQSTTTTTGSTTTSGGTSGGAWLGGVTMPAEEGMKGEKPKETAASTTPEGEQRREEPVAAPGETLAPRESGETPSSAAAEEKKFVAHKGVLERFREFKGEKTPKSLMALFDADPIPGIRQEPVIALSDGKSKVKLFIELPVTGKEAPNFALKGAKLISLKTEGKAWVVEALPKEKVNEATVTVLQDGAMTEIPVTVVQPLDKNPVKAGALDEASFILFLKERGTEKAPRYDLNGDGVRNEVDDYIFTANYLLNELKKKPKGETKATQKDEPKIKPKDEPKTKQKDEPKTEIKK